MWHSITDRSKIGYIPKISLTVLTSNRCKSKFRHSYDYTYISRDEFQKYFISTGVKECVAATLPGIEKSNHQRLADYFYLFLPKSITIGCTRYGTNLAAYDFDAGTNIR